MRLLIIGNNDGPLRLVRAVTDGPHRVVAVGLQRYDERLATDLAGYGVSASATPDEASATALAAGSDFDLLVNCFANFRYRRLHHHYPTVNVHLAPLPHYRGRHPLQWALINGEPRFGVTLHRLTDAFDDGAILWQGAVDIVPGWSALELREALLDRFTGALPDLLSALEADQLPELPNEDGQATYVTRRSPADSLLHDWADRDRVWRKVRALRHDAHPARLRTPTGEWALHDAHRGERRFVGFRAGHVVGRRADAREIVCADGHTVWLYGAFGAALPINAAVL